jgi:dTMP kinase
LTTPPSRLGRFIVFEGLDGSGSSTQSSLLAARLMRSGLRVTSTAEPSSGPVGQLIRLSFSGRVVLPEERSVRDAHFAYLFAADRFDHLYNPTNGVLKDLAAGIDVVCTRYLFSSLAYNGETPEEEALIRRLNADFPMPDALIYLRGTVELSARRLSSRTNLETYENREKLAAVQRNYDRILDTYTGRKLIVDATLSRNAISDQVFDFVDQTEPTLARKAAVSS